jgi:steroid delta-isomerase-like uncharacterized protein
MSAATATTTQATMEAYLEALVARGDFGQYLAEDATITLEGTDQRATGRAATVAFITYMHQQVFDARPELKNLFTAEGKAAIEADFVGTHTGEFMGIPASGRGVRVPYSVIYDVRADQITALRVYLPVQALLAQIGA